MDRLLLLRVIVAANGKRWWGSKGTELEAGYAPFIVNCPAWYLELRVMH